MWALILLASRCSLQSQILESKENLHDIRALESLLNIRPYQFLNARVTRFARIQWTIVVQVPGDGRELVVSICTAFKVRAEDGRRVEGVNLSPFISNLPFGETSATHHACKYVVLFLCRKMLQDQQHETCHAWSSSSSFQALGFTSILAFLFAGRGHPHIRTYRACTAYSISWQTLNMPGLLNCPVFVVQSGPSCWTWRDHPTKSLCIFLVLECYKPDTLSTPKQESKVNSNTEPIL